MGQVLKNAIQLHMAALDREQRRKFVRKFNDDKARNPNKVMTRMPDDGEHITWSSASFLAVAWPCPHPDVLVRLSINRAAIDMDGNWLAGISWDELQRVKNECGFGKYDAVEVYPRDDNVVNVANMRHLWIMAKPLEFSL